MLDVSSTCRTCMKSNVGLVDLFVPLQLDNCILQLAELLMTTVSVQVSRDDGLPPNICDECVKLLETVCTFRTQALKADDELRKLVSQPQVKNEEDIDFKNENTLDYFDNYEMILSDVVPKEETELKEEVYNCNRCQKQYTRHKKFLKHLAQHEQSTFACSACNKPFLEQSSLDKHIAKHCKKIHKYSTETNIVDGEDLKAEDVIVKTENDDESTFKCPECSLTFNKHRSLVSHLKKHRYEGVFKSKIKYQCDFCDKQFSGKGLLRRHLKLHSEEKTHKCDKCPKRYSRVDQLAEHMRKHNGVKPYPCPHCDKAFTQLCSLKDHIRTHTGETPYLCSQCGKGFTNSSNLRQHLLRHSGVKPFACNLCPKTFSTKGQMKAHIETHTGVHPHKCAQCGAAFTKPNSLKKHQLIHLGVKPFACDTCNMRFTCKDHLKRHQRIHTGEKPYRCSFCERAFTQSNDLVKHVRVHVGQNIYQCTVCHMKFRLLRELKSHYPIHYVNGADIPQLDKDQPLVFLKGCQDEKTSEDMTDKETDSHITITFNSNVLEKDGIAGDITINIGPPKS